MIKLKEAAERLLRGELTGEEFFDCMIAFMEDCGSVPFSDEIMIEVAKQLVK